METILFSRGKNNIQQVYRIFKRLADIESKWKDIQFNTYKGYFDCSVVYDKNDCQEEYAQIGQILSFENGANHGLIENNSDVIRKKFEDNKSEINILLIDDQAKDVYKDKFTDEKFDYNFILKKSIDQIRNMEIADLNNIDLILLDIKFKEGGHHDIRKGEGFIILKYLGNIKSVEYIPIVMFSNYDWDQDIEYIIDYCWQKGSLGFYNKDELKGKLGALIKSIANINGEEIIISIDEEDINAEKDRLKQVLKFFQNQLANIEFIKKTDRNRLLVKINYFESEDVGALYRKFKRSNQIPNDNKNVKFHLAELYKQMRR